MLPPHRGQAAGLIGDVHGCREKLDQLLDKVGFRPKTDHVVAIGDLVNKGPDTLGAIDLLRSIEEAEGRLELVRRSKDDAAAAAAARAVVYGQTPVSDCSWDRTILAWTRGAPPAGS
ncbi:hypothetical protein GGTG_02426 [Gaeumannomyces tritici R3-111a-1]|uniref:Calcineurin-like phosphoesterase domain-containing protein n=1 Tax=Gaeumannomyces tritici (strain R3-111a-1) TaxID=644352 RepID=J3NMC2_GAET3|nr:hypothetical protein GGTG_02426 [Gaeumannomyces tritici R3-111a-1]EJT82453.1 hypothetical protein GGTG_02426 [Gaeumannomyces tritici R3-111a-1]